MTTTKESVVMEKNATLTEVVNVDNSVQEVFNDSQEFNIVSNDDVLEEKCNEGNTMEQELVLQTVTIPQHVNVKIEPPETSIEEVKKMNNRFDMVNGMYENVLGPQLEKNEEQKREHKTTLVTKLFELLKNQFIFTYCLISGLFIVVFIFGLCKIENDIILNIIDFVKFYITVIVAELIAILFFIVKNVFDKSIVELISNFDKNEKEKNEKDKNRLDS